MNEGYIIWLENIKIYMFILSNNNQQIIVETLDEGYNIIINQI